MISDVLPWMAGVLGLLIGSFLNVCIYRLPRGGSLVSPPSRCPGCETPIRWRDNIPVLSWLWLRGRCASCGQPISIRYPIVELVTAALFVALAWTTGPGPLLGARLLFVAMLVVLFATDLELQILPDAVTLPGIVAGVVLSVVTPLGWESSLIGVAAGGGLLWFVAEVYFRWRHIEGLGGGDIKMNAMIGAFLGWPTVLIGLVLAAVSGAVVGTVLGRGDMKHVVPFGVFLAAAALALVFFEAPILAAYWRLIEWYLGVLGMELVR
ncbi:MAG: A24 family peptidase [Vicinamibacterales bacterium]